MLLIHAIACDRPSRATRSMNKMNGPKHLYWEIKGKEAPVPERDDSRAACCFFDLSSDMPQRAIKDASGQLKNSIES